MVWPVLCLALFLTGGLFDRFLRLVLPLLLCKLCGNLEFVVIGSWSEFCVGSGVSNPVLSVHCGSKSIRFSSSFWVPQTAGEVR